MADFLYPTSAELKAIEQDKLPRLIKDRMIFDLMPVTDAQSHRLMWEQRDNYTGLQAVRGLGGAPSRVSRIGGKRYDMEPGVYGEFIELDETELTLRRKWGTFGTPIDVKDLVMEAQEQLLQRRLDRIEQIGWTLLTTGTFSVSAATGGVLHTDTFPIQTFTAGVAWGTSATATPLANFRAVKLLARGHSTNFGPGSKALMNQVTFNKLVTNTNANDLAGRRVTGLLSPLNLGEINSILLGEGLPQIEIVDFEHGYLNDAGTFVPFIGDDTCLVVGTRPAGQKIAEYRMTLNLNNPDGGAGAYTRVVDDERRLPRAIQVHDGHNGGPVIYYPASVVKMAV